MCIVHAEANTYRVVSKNNWADNARASLYIFIFELISSKLEITTLLSRAGKIHYQKKLSACLNNMFIDFIFKISFSSFKNLQ